MSTDNDPMSTTELASKMHDAYSTMGVELYEKIGSRKFDAFIAAIRGFDINRKLVYMPTMEHSGHTFFTRPRLNLTTTSLRQDRIMSLLDTLQQNTVNFAIRFLLDTDLRKMYPGLSGFSGPMSMVNPENPFLPILSNHLHSISGWPDFVIETENTDGGFYGETITYPKGHDQLSRGYELQATFNDAQGNVVAMLLMMWTRYIYLITMNRMVSYRKDITNRRMSFTSSIYRFIMDPSNTYITKWAKATGAFPKTLPIGNFFNYDKATGDLEAIRNITTAFTVAGKIDYMDPIVLLEFNMLAEKFAPSIKNYAIATKEQRLKYGFKCLPYIDLSSGTNELQWRYDTAILDADVQADYDVTADEIEENLETV